MDEKYFIPEDEELRIGYECELIDYASNNYGADESTCSWTKHTIKREHMFSSGYKEDAMIETFLYYLSNKHLRVPYLTKEQIEKDGWKYTGKSIDIWFEKEGNFEIGNWTSYKVVLHYNLSDYRIQIIAMDIGGMEGLFQGKCKDINTFRQICKLLGI